MIKWLRDISALAFFSGSSLSVRCVVHHHVLSIRSFGRPIGLNTWVMAQRLSKSSFRHLSLRIRRLLKSRLLYFICYISFFSSMWVHANGYLRALQGGYFSGDFEILWRPHCDSIVPGLNDDLMIPGGSLGFA